jgi:hypothetical protein
MSIKTDGIEDLIPDHHLGFFDEFEEHGQPWLSCAACGASWSIVDTSNGPDLEQIDEGDEYCLNHSALVSAACDAADIFDADELERGETHDD